MSGTEDTPQKVSDLTLPYKTDDQDVLRLIEAIKRKPDNEKAIKEIYDKSNFETSRKALEILGILNDRLSFSGNGRELAIGKDDNQREKLFLRILLNYPPYGHFLESLSHSGNLSTTDTESIKDYWWKHEYGSSISNREDGVVTFGKLLQLAGIGTFVTGRRGQPSRIEWNANAKLIIDAACSSETYEPISTEQAVNNDFNQVTTFDSVPLPNNYLSNTQESTVQSRDHIEQSYLNGAIPKIIPSISISVDMSEWDTSKIITFFKATYGIFDDSEESNLSTACSQSFSEPSDGHSDT